MIFDPQFFLLSSIILDGWPSEKIILHLSGNFPRKCALTDPQSQYFPLKISKP